MQTKNSKSLFDKAKHFIPGGVNSPVRAFNSVGGDPRFMSHAKGAYMFDEDGNKYIDLINSWGPMILGHANEAVERAIFDAVKSSPSFGTPGAREVEIAEIIVDMIPAMDMVRMVNSGTEATMSAVRLARGFTGRDKIVKVEGCYHGHGDSFLIAAGSGALTMGVPNSPGVTEGTAKDTLLVPFNDLSAFENLIEENKGEIAAFILEPVAGNMGCVLPQNGYLKGLREKCTAEGIVLIFDEVMTGFRLSEGGAQKLFGIDPDLTTLGKIIGGGMPVGAYGGKKEIMNFVAPQGPVYQAGTLSGNPVAMAAGLAMLKQLKGNDVLYKSLETNTKRIVHSIEESVASLGLKYTTNQIGSMYSLFFTDKEVIDFDTAKTTDTAQFGKYFQEMLKRGIYLAPSQYETLFVSTAIGEAEIDAIVQASTESLKAIS
ncbi:MAG: glutamate-1-semialdehyde 2,1-aminomutase [Cyclobacteriaceae bacterium]